MHRPDCIEVDRDIPVFVRNPAHICEGLSGTFVSAFVHTGEVSDPFLTDAESAIARSSHQDDQQFELISMLAAQRVEDRPHQFLREFIVVPGAELLFESVVYQ